MTEKPLVLRHNPIERADHYQVYRASDDAGVGTILKAMHVATADCWEWCLNGAYKGPQPMSGSATSLEEAMTKLRAAWDRWQPKE